MLNISENLKEQLLKEFRTQKKLESAILNKELFKFESLNSLQIQRLFNLEQKSIFTENNAKKHLKTIQEMIKTHFASKKTTHYLTYFLNPTNSQKELESRQFELNSNTTDEQKKEIRNLTKNLSEINIKIKSFNNIICLNEKDSEYLYQNFKIICDTIKKSELEQQIEFLDENAIIISDENLYLEEFEQFTLKDFKKVIKGNIIYQNKNQILNLINLNNLSNSFKENFNKFTKQLANINFKFEKTQELEKILNTNYKDKIEQVTNKINNLEIEIEELNNQLKDILSNKNLSLNGEEVLKLLNSGNLEELQKKLQNDTKELISQKEKEIISFFKEHKINTNFIFENHSYPVKIDEEIKETLYKKLNNLNSELELEIFKELGEFDLKNIESIWNFSYFLDFYLGIEEFKNKFELINPNFSQEIKLINGKNIYIENPSPVNYGVGVESCPCENQEEIKLNNEKVCILTGANSGGKTTLLEMILQSQVLTMLGLGICSKQANIKLFDEIIYLKKFTGTQGSGAFEQTIRSLIEILDKPTSKLILIDEFEAVTEPGAAAKILLGFLTEITKQNSFCVAASHLGEELQKEIKEKDLKGIRIDGISAQGLDEKGNLITNHQPIFNSLGKSTPELILKRILQDEPFWKGKNSENKNILEKIIKN